MESSSEMAALIKVTSTVAASMTYARFAASSIRPGFLRLLCLLPVVLLLPFLPFSFTTIHPRGVSAFFLAWLAIFKLLLLSFDLGPLSPSLPLLTFIATSSLPVKIRPINKISTSSSSSSKTKFKFLISFAAKAGILALIIPIYQFKNQIHEIHPYLLLSIYCIHLYLALDLVLSSAGFLAGVVLNLDLEPQFNAPFKSTSLQDFWGRRWNLMVTGILRPSVYVPVRERWGSVAGVAATFLVSGVMHEVMFYYLTEVGPTGEVTWFFVIHGVCVVLEGKARREGWWRPNAVVGGAVTLAFVAGTGFWLFFPQILRGGADERVLEESREMVRFLEEGGRAVLRRVRGIGHGGDDVV